MKPKSIYIYSPSGAVRDKAAFRRGVRFLEKKGCDVQVDPAALSSHQRFAGTDEERLLALQRAADSGADIALISRGGYGLTRLLDQIPYAAIADACQRGTQFVGFSDFTALQLGLLTKNGSLSWAGPALCEGFGAEEPDDIMVDCFWDLLERRGEGTGWRLPKAVEPFEVNDALLWGGNLTTLCALVGTPYLPGVNRGVLFLEDVGEHPYRVERQLSQLLWAGILQKQSAIVLGQFTGFQLSSHDRGFKMDSVVSWLRSRLDIPIFTNLPFGHVPTKVLLPVGAKVDLTAHDRDIFLVWGHL